MIVNNKLEYLSLERLPSLACNAGAYPSEETFRCSILEWAPSLTHKR